MFEDILNGREERYLRQNLMQEKYKLPLLLATVIYPGDSKVNPVVNYIYEKMITELKIFRFQYSFEGINAAGPYFIGCFKDDVYKIKHQTVILEDTHSLGRLFDIDIINYPYHKISRDLLQITRRRCIICQEEALICIREQKHSQKQLITTINKMVEDYKHATRH